MITRLYLVAFVFAILLSACGSGIHKTGHSEGRLPVIFPDYTSLIIPVNIAPLNFIIKEEAQKYSVHFSGPKSKGFVINSDNDKITIPIIKWKKLLNATIEDSIKIVISVKIKNVWHSFNPIYNYISPDSLDSYIVYRKINPALVLWNDMAIVQRSTETFDESSILENRNTGGNCMHCHTFQNRNPENFMLHLRAPGGTFIKSNGITRWLETKTPYTIASFAYPAWHPTKNLIAFSTNKIQQAMYASGEHLNVVFDDVSDIVVYDIEKNLVFTSPKIASKNLENLPEWSPDGKYLYYINCPIERKLEMGKLVKYDFMRIAFNAETREWGNLDTLLTSATTGLSISFPKASPDGKFIIFCMADFGYFTITNPTTDLYIMDLSNKKYRKLGINSSKTESFHDWSLNSRWIVLASKREDGIITLPYFCHIDEKGLESKAFVLPAEDPESLKTSLFNYNRPVFVSGKVTMSQEEILSEIAKKPEKVIFDSINVAIDSLEGLKSNSGKVETSIYLKK